MGYGAYDKVNQKLGLSKESTQLDWITKASKHQIFFYDENQSIKPADVRPSDFKKLNAKQFTLETQMRVEAGAEFIQLIDDFFAGAQPKMTRFENYDFKLFDSLEKMITQIKAQEKTHKLARVVAGYAWPWHTNPGRPTGKKYDIDLDGLKLVWNSTPQDWVNSPNAINEVGCIHTIQGYDLNFVGVIIGPELSYDPTTKKFKVDREKYFDTNGRNGITDPEELERYVINIYKTLLTRGIMGTYVYICDEGLRSYFKDFISISKKRASTQKKVKKIFKSVVSPYMEDMVSLPLYDSIGCGEATYADPVSHESYEVPSSLISRGAKYFVLRTSGDSMNKLGINDGDYILCQKNYQAPSGSVSVVLVGDDATLKEIKYESDGLTLIPHSTNPKHKQYKLVEGDEFKVLGTFVKKLENFEEA